MNIKEGCIEILYSNCKLIHTACSLRVTRILLLEFAKFVRMFRSQALSHDFSAVYTNLPPWDRFGVCDKLTTGMRHGLRKCLYNFLPLREL